MSGVIAGIILLSAIIIMKQNRDTKLEIKKIAEEMEARDKECEEKVARQLKGMED